MTQSVMPPALPYQHGQVWPLGIPVSLSWVEIGAILFLIHEYKIRTFFEFGVERGGLSSLLCLRQMADPDFSYHGFEKYRSKLHPQAARLGRHCITYGDMFSKRVRFTIQTILKHSHKPLLVFCDDGDKPREAKLARELFPGAYVLVHDYGKEFKDSDQPPGTDRISHPWLEDTRLFFMKNT